RPPVILLGLAEAANAFEPLKAGEEVVRTDRYVLFLGLGPTVNVAQRLRFAADSVARTVDEVHARVRARGGRGLTWEVASSATPADLADRLLALGALPARDPLAVVMALRRPPDRAP